VGSEEGPGGVGKSRGLFEDYSRFPHSKGPTNKIDWKREGPVQLDQPNHSYSSTFGKDKGSTTPGHRRKGRSV